MSVNIEFQLDDESTTLEQKFTLSKNATIEQFALKLHVLNNPTGNLHLEIKEGATVLETVTLTSAIINTNVVAQLGVAENYKLGYFAFAPSFPMNLRRDTEYTLKLSTSGYIFSAAASFGWIIEYTNETNLVEGTPENDLGKAFSYRLHGFKEYGGFIMPRTATFFDGQQSAVAPDLGTLNRKVTGTQGAPLNIVAGVGIPILDCPVEMIFVEGTGGVNITASPQIAAGTEVGQELNIYGTSDIGYVRLDDGDGLSMNGSLDLDSETNATFLWTGTVWKLER